MALSCGITDFMALAPSLYGLFPINHGISNIKRGFLASFCEPSPKAVPGVLVGVVPSLTSFDSVR